MPARPSQAGRGQPHGAQPVPGEPQNRVQRRFGAPRPGPAALQTSVAPGSAAHPGPAGHRGADHGQPDWGGPAYEVMYLLSDSSDAAVSGLRERLDTIGDSVLVVGGEDLW